MKRIVFRTDAALHIGTGHVMRCLTLAAVLRERGAEIAFVCREHAGNLCEHIAAQGFTVHRLAPSAAHAVAADAPPHAHWLGAGWREDAAATMAAIDQTIDVVVVDHYGLDQRWESALRTRSTAVMVIDDLADRPHDCDILLDQNLVAQMETRYATLVPSACTVLAGPRYALLQPLYARMHAQARAREGAVRRILVFFGGVDRDGLTLRTVRALLALGHTGWSIDVVLGTAHPDRAQLELLAGAAPHIQLHAAVPSLAPLMEQADLAIGAGGATSWERLCLGLPSLIVTVADNQRPIAAELARRGLADWLGDAATLSDASLLQALTRWRDDGIAPDWFPDHAQLVDGAGAQRVGDVLMQAGVTPLPLAGAVIA